MGRGRRQRQVAGAGAGGNWQEQVAMGRSNRQMQVAKGKDKQQLQPAHATCRLAYGTSTVFNTLSMISFTDTFSASAS